MVFGKGKRIICSPDGYAVNRALKKLKGQEFKWVYLGEDVSKLILIEKVIGIDTVRIETAAMLQKIAHNLRQQYIDYVGELSVKNNSLMWWATRVSEKNPFVSKTLLNICYVKLFEEINDKCQNENLIILIENKAVRKTIMKNTIAENVELIENPIESSLEFLKDIRGFLFHKCGFLAYNIYRILVSKYIYKMHKRINKNEPLLLVHTFVDRRSFDKEGRYTDSYFGNLVEYLKTRKNVVIVPQIWRVMPYKKTIETMMESKEIFLTPHSLLSVSDVLQVFLSTLPNMHGNKNYPLFEKIDISEIIKEDMKQDWVDGHAALGMMFYHFVKRLRTSNFLIDSVVYTYENHAWEKVLSYSFHEFYPDTYKIGYQHAVFSDMSLSHFFSKKEAEIMPSPDRIVTNGKYPREVFINSCYPKEKVVEGGAIKYISQKVEKIKRPEEKRDRINILVTPTVGKTAIELILKVVRALGNKERYNITIRNHPLIPFEKISKHLNVGLPQNVKVANRPFSELIKESDILIYTSSATCIEAAAAGVPMIHVKSDLSIDLDPLYFYPEARPSASTENELIESVDKLANMSEKEYAKNKKIWDNIVRDFFGNVDDSVFKLFTKNTSL